MTVPSDFWLYLLAGAAVVAFFAAQRVPVIRLATKLAFTAALVGTLLFVLVQREKFDPYLGRAAELLSLDRQEVVGTETRIEMSRDGHFWARARINGVERRLLIDSGATVTALSTTTAADAELAPTDSPMPLILKTANGTVRPQVATIAELGLGNIVARDLQAVVSPAFGDTNVLGMNFLSRLKSWRVEGRTLILTPNHPQDGDLSPAN